MKRSGETLPAEISCGVDEAGRGPVIGPLVVSIVCGETSKFREIGVKDSKTLSRTSRERLYNDIVKQSAYYRIKEITAAEINSLMTHKNLNVIEEDAYSELIGSAHADCQIYVDSFDVDPERLTIKLSTMTGRNVLCRHKADSIYPSVSAASILSKVTRDNRIMELEKEYGPIGSGYPSDPYTVDFLIRCRDEGTRIDEIARTHWKTYRNIFGDGKTSRLF
ncbi:MAG: ribonuclease HII [Candidatus Thermoplasmatota archaeon]|nr:ribonuclease HII [Candidatus Thermoplasmatota archaeon]